MNRLEKAVMCNDFCYCPGSRSIQFKIEANVEQCLSGKGAMFRIEPMVVIAGLLYIAGVWHIAGGVYIY
jgi:hypothetical protein